MIQATWNSLTWQLDNEHIKLLAGAAISRTLKKEDKQTKDGQNPTNTLGYEPRQISLKYSVSPTVGTDPLKELANLKKLCGMKGTLYVAGKKLGPSALMLDKVDFTTDALNGEGKIIKAEFTLNFSEDTDTAPAPEASQEQYYGQDTSTPTPGVIPKGIGGSAYDIRPTAESIKNKLNLG